METMKLYFEKLRLAVSPSVLDTFTSSCTFKVSAHLYEAEMTSTWERVSKSLFHLVRAENGDSLVYGLRDINSRSWNGGMGCGCTSLGTFLRNDDWFLDHDVTITRSLSGITVGARGRVGIVMVKITVYDARLTMLLLSRTTHVGGWYEKDCE
jgi:hypothetical protein